MGGSCQSPYWFSLGGVGNSERVVAKKGLNPEQEKEGGEGL